MSHLKAYDVVLVIDRFSARYLELEKQIRSLQSLCEDSRLLCTSIHYRHKTDVALLILSFDARVTTGPLLWRLSHQALRAGWPLLELPKLSSGDRQRFLTQHLQVYGVVIRDLPTPIDAVRVLSHNLGLDGTTPPPELRASGPPPLEVRFRRGHDWLPGRICRMSTEGLFIATGGPPRLGDVVDVEVAFRGQSARSRVSVLQVTPAHAAEALGAAGFGGRFLFESRDAHRVMDYMLKQARNVAPRMAPPPRRRHVRYPLRWPASFAFGRRRLTGRVLDVSQEGLFLEGEVTVREGDVMEVLMPSDERGAPLRARGRVARSITPQMAASRWLPPGAGLELTGVEATDQKRFREFVTRVGRRAQRRVVIGAPRERLDTIVAEFGSVGYAVIGAEKTSEVMSRVAETQRAPDVVILDAELERTEPRGAATLTRTLNNRGLTLLRFQDEPAADVRHLVDAALVA